MEIFVDVSAKFPHRLGEAGWGVDQFLKYCERYYSAKIKFEPVFYHLSDRPNVSFIFEKFVLSIFGVAEICTRKS